MKCKITVFTPTYNRESLLPRLFESLKKQKETCFEWLIIDDDSSDNTEEVVNQMMLENVEFSIRYYRQEHGGKHRAINKALQLARGEYFFIVDSDDFITDNAVALISSWIDEVGSNENICAVSGLKVSAKGNVWGDKPAFKNQWVDASNFERTKYNLWGDKAEVYRTDIMKKFPFPEFDGEFFVTEAVCWDRIAAEGYKIRWYNEPIYVCDYLEDGLTQSGANEFEGHRKNYKGYCYYIKQCMGIKPVFEKVTNFREYNKTARLLKKNIKERAADLKWNLGDYIIFMYIKMPVFYIGRIIWKLFM